MIDRPGSEYVTDPFQPMKKGDRLIRKRDGGKPNESCQKANAEGKCVIGTTEAKNEPPAWHNWAHVAFGAASLVPGLNFLSTTGDVVLYAYDGEYGEALAATAGYIPGGEEARLAFKGAKGAVEAERAAKLAKEAKELKEAKAAKDAKEAKEAKDARKAEKEKEGESVKKDKKKDEADARCIGCDS